MDRFQHAGRVLIYGGKGALGSTIVSVFKAKNWWVGSIDMNKNSDADVNILVEPKEAWTDQCDDVLSSLEGILDKDKIDALICVAGGWAGGSASSDDFVKTADMMWKQSVWPSIISAKIASKYLKDGGLLTLTGAKAAMEPTPGMIGYGMAKSAVHHLVSSLSTPKSGMPDKAHTIGILPITLDTPMNRKFMPKADFSSWTPTSYVAELMYLWTQSSCPESGSLALLETKNGETKVTYA